MYYSHHLTCYIHSSLCVEFSVWFKKWKFPHDPMSETQFNDILHSMWATNFSDTPTFKHSIFQHPCPNKIKLGILLGQRHGGTNWFIGELNKYQRIYTRKELLLSWEADYCSKFAKYVEFSKCTDISLIQALDHIYNSTMYSHGFQKLCTKHKTYYYFFKIQITQIPPYLFQTLIDYIYHHNIMVIHLIREASVASFYSFQALVVERVYSADIEKITNKHAQVDKDDFVNRLELDPAMALRYVRNIDTNRMMIAKLIKLYPGYIKYQRYDYEDLSSDFGEFYWKSMFNFIGGPKLMDKMKSGKRIAKLNRSREHSNACFTRISNWNEVKQSLQGFDSYYACEKIHS